DPNRLTGVEEHFVVGGTGGWWWVENQQGLLTPEVHMKEGYGANIAGNTTAFLRAIEVEMITPAGDPVASPENLEIYGQNEFTFSWDNPGVLTMDLRVLVTPAGAASDIAEKCYFTVGTIGSSTMAWDAANPGGKPVVVNDDYLEATVTFTGLPANNSDFGRKTAALYLDGSLMAANDYEVFFRKIAVNHPGGTSTDPNWFYYWKDGNVCGIDSEVLYDPIIDYGKYVEGDLVVYVGYEAAEANDGIHTYVNRFDSTTIQGTGNGKGIKCVAETIAHEQLHKHVYQNLSGTDNDADNIPDAMEGSYLGISTATNHPDTFDMAGIFGYSGYYDYGDEEVRCRVSELNVSYDTTKDWANPGSQSKIKWGP
ncbi:MAG: hypothetical protein V3V05_04915, partial [Pontiella sp.]